jgi:dUTPase
MIISKHETATWQVVEELGTTERGIGGYGSTGK